MATRTSKKTKKSTASSRAMSKVVAVRFSQAQYDEVKSFCAKRGIKSSSFVRDAALILSRIPIEGWAILDGIQQCTQLPHALILSNLICENDARRAAKRDILGRTNGPDLTFQIRESGVVTGDALWESLYREFKAEYRALKDGAREVPVQ